LGAAAAGLAGAGAGAGACACAATARAELTRAAAKQRSTPARTSSARIMSIVPSPAATASAIARRPPNAMESLRIRQCEGGARAPDSAAADTSLLYIFPPPWGRGWRADSSMRRVRGAPRFTPSPRLPSGRLRPSSTGYGEGGVRGPPRESEPVETPPHRAEFRFPVSRVALSPRAGRGAPCAPRERMLEHHTFQQTRTVPQ
jgi:hypothetical protein